MPGPDSGEILSRLLTGLDDAEFAIPGHLVADIGVVDQPRREADGSMTVALEALTVAED
ncbi:MAG: hypothetical protein H0U83_07255 [Sphingomonas sp.]|nr:hypothetical protein [Sphingomonas sp.]